MSRNRRLEPRACLYSRFRKHRRDYFRTGRVVPPINEDLNRKTLGQLLRAVKRFATYGDEILETMDEALIKRNYLMHRFFPFHNFALFSVEGRKEMIAELHEIQKKLTAAHWMLIAMGDGLLAVTGKSLGDQEGLRERLLARGRRVEL